jgi:hypothetical protein
MNRIAPQPIHVQRRGWRGFLMLDLMAAVSLLTLAMFPLAYSFAHEARVLRLEYQRAVAIEIVDGEMEILAAGDWRNFPDGTRDYPVHARSAVNLPAGKFQLTKTGNHLRLECKSDGRPGVGPVVREANIK